MGLFCFYLSFSELLDTAKWDTLTLVEAKDLLLSANLSVRDIALEIGQQSLGTFPTRFTERVGMTPGRFRNSWMQVDHLFRSLHKLKDWRTPHAASSPYAKVEGTVLAEIPFEGFVLIGLFPKPIPEHDAMTVRLITVDSGQTL